MTVLFLVFVPVALLALISGFCFVGCVLNTKGTGFDPDNPNPKPKPFTKYSDTDVINHPDIVAYWPLGELSGSPKAVDVIAAHNGDYTDKGSSPELFPCPATQIPPGGPIISAAATGFLDLGSVSIVSGDAKQPGDDPNILTTGMQINGAFVSVPLPSVINPSMFSVEAWVRTEWDATEVATRAVVDSRSVMGGVAGFVLWNNNAGNWEALFNGTNGGVMNCVASSVLLGQVAHIVLTFDGTYASIFVNGTRTGGPSEMPAGSNFNPNTTQPMIIGAGFRFEPLRTAAKEDQAFPLIPFNGTIQDVAIYNAVLSDDDITKHFNDGSGKTTVPAG